MAIRSRVKLGVRCGIPSTTTCPVVIATLTDPASSGITLTVNGTNYAHGDWDTSPAQVGTDRGALFTEAGWVGSHTVTGLTAFTQYTWTVTQGSDSETGSFYTLPSDSDDFSFFFLSCDRNTFANAPQVGLYNIIQDYAQNGALPTIGMWFVDDIGYVDTSYIDDSGTGNTGHLSTGYPGYLGIGTAKQYDYALGWLATLGMFEDTTKTTKDPIGINNKGDYISWGREENRAWCNQNLNIWPQWGDHEFIDDIGWSGQASVNAAYVPGKAMWDAFMKPLYSANLINASNGYHWSATVGPCLLVTPDSITNANKPAATPVIYGNSQIDDCLTEMNTSDPFKLLGMTHGIRGLTAAADGDNGTQHALFDNVLGEYQRMFTATGGSPASLMENEYTNGKFGQLLVFHGDYHGQQVVKNEDTSGSVNERFYSVYAGTVNGSSNEVSVPLGSTLNGSISEYVQTQSSGGTKRGITRIDVYGSRYPKELHVHMIDDTEAIVYSQKITSPRGGNLLHDTSKNLSTKGGITSSDE